jgi:hypothetical protein
MSLSASRGFIETFASDDDGNLLIKTYYPMPETVGSDSDPYAHLLEGQPQHSSEFDLPTPQLARSICPIERK